MTLPAPPPTPPRPSLIGAYFLHSLLYTFLALHTSPIHSIPSRLSLSLYNYFLAFFKSLYHPIPSWLSLRVLSTPFLPGFPYESFPIHSFLHFLVCSFLLAFLLLSLSIPYLKLRCHWGGGVFYSGS